MRSAVRDSEVPPSTVHVAAAVTSVRASGRPPVARCSAAPSGPRGRRQHEDVADAGEPGVPPGPALQRGRGRAEPRHRVTAPRIAQQQVGGGAEGQAGGGRDVHGASCVPARPGRPSLGSVVMRLPGRYDGVARPIVTYGSDPVLHRPCAPVTEFDRDLRHLRAGHVRLHGGRRRRGPGGQPDRRGRPDLRHRLPGRRRARTSSATSSTRR